MCVHTEVSMRTHVYTGTHRHRHKHAPKSTHTTCSSPYTARCARRAREGLTAHSPGRTRGCPAGQRVKECPKPRSLGTGCQGKPSHIKTDEKTFTAQGSHRSEAGGRGGAQINLAFCISKSLQNLPTWLENLPLRFSKQQHS